MSERLKSVGLDVGTTSTQLIVSELTIENRASSFAVPEMEIAQRRILYKSPVHFTPLLEESLVDAAGLRKLLEEEYRRAGISRGDVDTGAVIVTGETSRKENARAVLEALADMAGDFVVATAGPDLESVLAARGAGAVAYSEKTGKTVLHMDIGGGTSNLALIRDGKILKTGCLNVGGRLVKLEETGQVRYVSPVLEGLWKAKPGEIASTEELEALARQLTEVLEMAAGRRRPSALLQRLTTAETGRLWVPPEEEVVCSFSGGVAECIRQDHPPLAFGDLGPLLGKAIRGSALCRGEYVLGEETIRATVIGAGCHSAQLSGSTVFCQNIRFPLKNLPVARVETATAEAIRRTLAQQEGEAVLAMPGIAAPSYRQVAEMAEQILVGFRGRQILICLEQDMAKALGQALAVRTEPGSQILCIDRVRLEEGSFLDVGEPVGPALPVVVKTLVLGR